MARPARRPPDADSNLPRRAAAVVSRLSARRVAGSLAILFAGLLALMPARAGAEGLSSTLEMAGRVVIEAPANLALIELTARSEAGSACDALALDAMVADRIVIRLSRFGVGRDDLETTGFRVETAAQPDNPMANPPGEVEVAVLGPEGEGGAGAGTEELVCIPAETYRIESGLTVRLRDFEALDDALAVLEREPDLTIAGVRYSLADADALLAQAKDAAIEDARAKAAAYADAMGLTLGATLGVQSLGARLVGEPVSSGEPMPVRAEAGARVTFEVRWDQR